MGGAKKVKYWRSVQCRGGGGKGSRLDPFKEDFIVAKGGNFAGWSDYTKG